MGNGRPRKDPGELRWVENNGATSLELRDIYRDRKYEEWQRAIEATDTAADTYGAESQQARDCALAEFFSALAVDWRAF